MNCVPPRAPWRNAGPTHDLVSRYAAHHAPLHPDTDPEVIGREHRRLVREAVYRYSTLCPVRLSELVDLPASVVRRRLHEMNYRPPPAPQRAKPQHGRAGNLFHTIRAALVAGPMTVSQIADATGLRPMSITHVLIDSEDRVFARIPIVRLANGPQFLWKLVGT